MGNFDGYTNAHKPGKALYDVQRHDRLWILLRLFERPRKHQYYQLVLGGTTANGFRAPWAPVPERFAAAP